MSGILRSLAVASLVVLALAGRASAAPQVLVDSLYTEYGAELPQGMGLILHVDFRALGLAGTRCDVNAVFFLPDGRPLKVAKRGQFVNTSGQVFTSARFTPSTDELVYEDYKLIIPYSAFPPGAGQDGQLQYRLEFRRLSDKSVLTRSRFEPVDLGRE